MVRIWGEEKYVAFCEMNSFKYRMRAGNKPTSSVQEDISKAQWYERQIAEMKNGKQIGEQEGNNLPHNISDTGGGGYVFEYSPKEDSTREE
ncbi:MAG: DUF3310 domain-containing protein [bacterium]|nr:DUF3310 domain-containing protein [bacterium]